MMDGFISHIISPEGHFLRENNVITIVPMLNVDGVVLGNFRTAIMGRDLNRQFHNPSAFPEIKQMR